MRPGIKRLIIWERTSGLFHSSISAFNGHSRPRIGSPAIIHRDEQKKAKKFSNIVLHFWFILIEVLSSSTATTIPSCNKRSSCADVLKTDVIWILIAIIVVLLIVLLMIVCRYCQLLQSYKLKRFEIDLADLPMATLRCDDDIDR